MPGTRDVALAIGVANADKLPYLGAAVNSAKAFYYWAQKMGYEAALLIDEDKQAPVTMQRLRATLDQLLKPSPGALPIHRCILYFAGHGLIREAEEGLWLLSDWYSQLNAVAVEVLKFRLYFYNISQIAIFSDACRSLPTDMQAAQLTADGVLGRGPYQASTMVAIDKFIAAQDGNVTYSIPGQNPEDDRCIFTGVLLEGLWGAAPMAFSKLLEGKVTSSSLGTYLKIEVPKVAARYQLALNPTVFPTFPEDDNVYYGSDPDSPSPPVFPDWPSPTDLIGRSPSAAGLIPNLSGEDTALTPDEPFKSEDYDLGINADSDSDRTRLTETFRRLRSMKDRSQEEPALASSSASTIFPDASVFATELRSQATDWRIQESGIELQGSRIKALWAAPSLNVAQEVGHWIVREHGESLRRPAPMLVELDRGDGEPLFVALTALPQFGAFLMCNEYGASALRYSSSEGDPSSPGATDEALEAMESGTLRSNQAKRLALSLRGAKHANPVLGVIAAYLYDSAGDLESIRRMAQFYIEVEQSIPYDVAMMGQLEGEWRGAELWAKVPPIPKRKTQEPSAYWDSHETPGGWGLVGGVWPWMKQGWAFLDAPEDIGSQLIRRALVDVRTHMTRARFATVDVAGATQLAVEFGLQRREEQALQVMGAHA